mmetsp:Transcript_59972/g.147450  ORF Transcript_59972/g.147450 Transcript_59972/m.147450 type:complete len:211 (-) Transcript_59972:557-1189(-)
MAGGLLISERRSTLSCGVKGSGSTMWRGKAERMRLRSWMHEGGMASQKLKWYSHRNSGKSWSSTSSTRSVPLYSSLMGSCSSALRRYGSMYLNSPIISRWKAVQPLLALAWRSRGMRERCETSSSHAKEKPETRRGWHAWRASAKLKMTASGIASVMSRSSRVKSRWRGFWLKRSLRSVCIVCITLTVVASALLRSDTLVSVVLRFHSSR